MWGPQLLELDDIFLKTGRGEEVVSPGGGGGTGRDRGGLHRLWDPPLPSHCLQLPRASYLGRQRQMAGSGPQPAEGTAEVDEDEVGLDQGGVGCLDLGTEILGGGSVGPVVRFK